MAEQSSTKYLLDRIIKVRFVYAATPKEIEENIKLWNEKVQRYNLLIETDYTKDKKTLKWVQDAWDYFQEHKGEVDVNNTSYYDIVIDPSTGGPKPDMTLSVSMLPGGLFQECTLTINNYNCPWDIHNYKRMEITAGYIVLNENGERQQSTRTFGIDIFYSYCKSPAPNSETVFKGIIVDKLITSTESFFSTRMNYTLEIYETTTLKNLVYACMYLVNRSMEEMGSKFRISAVFDQSLENIKGFLDYKIEMRYRYLTFTSIMDILRYLASNITKVGKTIILNNGTTLSIQCAYRGGDFYIFPVNGAYTKNEITYKLTSISSATLNAGIITVNAPWYPPITPGDLIEVSREYIDGSDFPNFLADSEVVSPDNLYRVLTMDVQFSSTGNQNNMSITAIPQRFVSDDTVSLLSGEKEFSSTYEILYKEGKEKVYTFRGTIGDKREDNTIIKYAKQNKRALTGHSFYDNGFVGTRKDAKKADISDVARGNYSGVGKLTCPESIKQWTSITKDGAGKYREYGPEYLWPVIYLYTFYYFEDKGAGPNNYSRLFEKNGEATLNHTFYKNDSYWVPKITSWADMKDFAFLYDAVISMFDAKIADIPLGSRADYQNIKLYLENM